MSQISVDLDDLGRDRASIQEMMASRPDYILEQVHGQRLYRHKDFKTSDKAIKLDKAAKGCEVFIGRLPRDCYEDELVPLFEQIAPIRVMRLMMDFSGTNRGYGFVLFDSPQAARKAVDILDGFKIRANHGIGVMMSWNKTRLFIGGIPKNKNKKDVIKEMKRVTENVKEVILYMSVYNQKNRGFCFVEYDTHHDAAMARRKLGDSYILWGKYEVRVDWADPEPEVDEATMKQVKIIHVRNLPLSVDEAMLKEIFSMDSLHVHRVKKIRDFAFIHYETRSETEEALRQTSANDFGKKYPALSRIQVSLARPQKCRVSRRRTNSIDSTPSEFRGFQRKSESDTSPLVTSAQSPQVYYPSPQSQVDMQLRYYQSLCGSQNQLMAQPLPQIPSPYKYDNIEEKSNPNFFIVWVPVFWVPQNNNKGLTFDDTFGTP